MTQIIQPEIFKKFENLVAIFTKKPLDFNSNTIEKNIIFDNFKIIENGINYKFSKIVSANQAHTHNAKIVTEDNLNDKFENVDGLVTSLKDVSLLIKVADCQAVMLYDPVKQVIANVHSGWRGTVDKIVVNTLEIMTEEYGCESENILAYISPSIGKCCFEVEKDVVDLFSTRYSNLNKYLSFGDLVNGKQKYFIDTLAINHDNLLSCGLLQQNIELSGICTKCNSDEIHSYRADKEMSGRNISMICMKASN